MTLQLTQRTAASVATPPAGVVDVFLDSADTIPKYRGPDAALHPLGGLSGWYDVTSYGVLTTNTAAQDITAMNALLVLAPNGSTIYFPPGIFLFNALWTMPAAKSFTFQGNGSNRAGSPATAFTEIQLTAILGATFITIASGLWYTQFRDICFTTTAVQTSGYCVDSNGNVGINFRGCTWQGVSGGTWFSLINYAGTNGGNSSLVEHCNMGGFTSLGINVDSNGSSVVVSHSVIQGIWGTSTQCATACISCLQVGALQIDNCDILGAVNNILSAPTVGKVCASLFANNTYFDNSLGSCIKVSGAGATVRIKFNACSMTTSNAGTAFTAIEIAGTFVFTVAAAQGVDIVGCNILNTFATTGTTNGVLCTNAADILISGCRVSGWTNGVQITPITSVTAPVIVGNIIGSSGGYGVNTVGILLNAGTYASQTIVGNNLMNNTTAITDNTTVNTTANNNRIIQKNQGFNPKSTVAQPAVPATTVAVFNSTGVDCTVYVKAGTLTVITVGGVATGITVGSGATGIAYAIPVAANQSIAITFTVAPTWIWVGT